MIKEYNKLLEDMFHLVTTIINNNDASGLAEALENLEENLASLRKRKYRKI